MLPPLVKKDMKSTHTPARETTPVTTTHMTTDRPIKRAIQRKYVHRAKFAEYSLHITPKLGGLATHAALRTKAQTSASVLEPVPDQDQGMDSLFVLGKRGNVVVEKHWRQPLNRQIIEPFWAQVVAAERPVDVPPATMAVHHVLLHVVRNEITLVGAVGRDVTPLLTYELLHRVADIFELYFRELTEDTLRDNFVTVYQLLDEMLDHGVPVHTEPNMLQELVLQPGKMKSMVAAVTGGSQVGEALPQATLGSVPWRRENVRYNANELYMDIVEKLSAVIDGRTSMLEHAEVIGDIECNCQLSGRPDLTLHIAEPYALEDVSFHPCVRLWRWEQNRCISFVPPDGPFTLGSYRVRGIVNLPIYVNPQISFGPGPDAGGGGGTFGGGGGGGGGGGSSSADSGCTGRVSVMVGSRAAQGRPIEDVNIIIPFPAHTLSSQLSANTGTVHFDETSKECIWRIGKLPNDKTPSLSGSVTLAPGGRPGRELSLTVLAEFKVSMYAASNIRVQSLRLDSEDYKPYKGVRTITQHGVFQIRT